MRIKLFLASFLILFLISTNKNVFADDTFDVNIVSFNDFHGSLLSNGDEDKNIGAARLATAIKELVAENPDNTVVISAGDNYNGSAMSNLLYGKPVSEVFRNIGILASGVGNHEFDWGIDKIPTWSQDMDAPFITANIYDKDTNMPVEWAEPYVTKEINGVTFGFLGLTTTETTFKTSPVNISNLDFKNPTETAEIYVPKMKEEGVDVVVLVTHIGTFQDEETGVVTLEENAEGLPFIEGIDAIITAHSHQIVSGQINDIPIIQSYYYGRALGKLTFTFDEDKNLINLAQEVDLLSDRKFEIPEDPEILKILNRYAEEVSPVLNEVIGYNNRELSHDRYTVSEVGKFTATVMRESAEADIAITNGGGLRSDLQEGEITASVLYTLIPFDNVLATYEMTGAQIREVFEHGIGNLEIGSIQFDGVTAVYIPDNPFGSRIVSLTLNNGEIVEDDKVYTVVTNDFMGAGGDGFTSFLEATLISETMPIRDVLAEAIRSIGTLNFDGREVLIQFTGESDEKTLQIYSTNEEGIAKDATIDTTIEEVVAEDATIDTIVEEVITEDDTIDTIVEEVQEPRSKVKVHIVVPGDTLYDIGISNNTTWNILAEYNMLSNPHLIFPGDEISIP